MLKIYTGNFGNIKLTTNDAEGFPVAPDFNIAPTVKLIDPDTNQIVVQASAVPISVDYPGEYEYVINSQYLQTDRVFKIEWTYSVDGVSLRETDYIYVVTPYVTIDEITEELGYSMRSEDPNYQPYEKIQSAERMARMMIDAELGFSLKKEQKTITAYGSGADVLSFPERIISISSITENDELVIDNTSNYNIFGFDVEITETNHGIRVVPPNPGDDIDEQEEFDYTGLTRGRFRNGYRYEINGVFGYSYIPQEIKQCMYLLINDILCTDSAWRNKYVKKINSGQMSVELSSLAYNGTGNAMVDAILQKFKIIQAVII